MSIWLTKDELIELTGYHQRDKQRRALVEMNVRFHTRHDGFFLVQRNQFETLTKTHRRAEPKFSATG